MAAACVSPAAAVSASRRHQRLRTTKRSPLLAHRVKAAAAAPADTAVLVGTNPLSGVSLLDVNGASKEVPFWAEDQVRERRGAEHHPPPPARLGPTLSGRAVCLRKS